MLCGATIALLVHVSCKYTWRVTVSHWQLYTVRTLNGENKFTRVGVGHHDASGL